MTPALRRFLPNLTTIGLALIVALLLVTVLVSEWNVNRLVDNEHRVLHTQEVLTALEEVLSTVTEAETAERGFLITDDEKYLSSYESAIVKVNETIERLTQLTRDELGPQELIAGLGERVAARLQELKNAIAARRAGGFDAARQSVSTNHGRQLMLEMRRLVAEMKEQGHESLAIAAAQSSRSAFVTTAIDYLGAALGIGMVCLAFYLFRLDVAHRERVADVTRRLAAIVESSDDAIVSKSLDGVIVSWNAGAQQVYGYTASEAVGQPITMLCAPEHHDDIFRILERVRRGIHIEHFETTRIRKDGRKIDISLSISPIKGARGEAIGASAIARDITEHKTLQREVLNIAALEQRRIGQELHDGIGQELTGLTMMMQRLVAELGDDQSPQSGTAARIQTRLEEALSHVRAMSKGLVPVEVDSEGLMVALADLAARTSELHGVSCSFECHRPVAIADNQTAMQLYRMSQEAVTNAVKHGHPRNIFIRLGVEGDRAILRVIDDGTGFAESAQNTAGTGLRIMRYRADVIGATLDITSARPHGAIVTCSVANGPILDGAAAGNGRMMGDSPRQASIDSCAASS
ncbi:MAG TPA: CHASE3 domain-containing protein [Planctomycetaceae bacterium]|nr:CHASE3 domain-containing protein [Planctomycetaceae bacterium]